MPLLVYGRDQGCAIIGGEHPYLFADYCTGTHLGAGEGAGDGDRLGHARAGPGR